MKNTIVGDEAVAEPVVNPFLHQSEVDSEALKTIFASAFDAKYEDELASGRINTPEARAKSRELHETDSARIEDLHALIYKFEFDVNRTANVQVLFLQRVDVGNDVHFLTGSSKVGMNYDASFLADLGEMEFTKDLLKVIAIAHATNTFAFRVGTIYNDIPLAVEEVAFIENCSNATSSWFKSANGLPKCNLVTLHDFADAKLMNASVMPTLDYNKCVLGASSGKESTFNGFILRDAGYEVHNVTFRNVEDIHSTDSSLELICLDDEDLTHMYLYPLAIGRKQGYAFDAQGVISVPRYAMLIIEALKKNAGVLAVGTEFGCSKIWYATDPENAVKGKEIHDLAVDEGAYICQQIEGLFKMFNLEVHIIAPTAVLHEVGILRALAEVKNFNLADLKSCWRANYLQHNYCGTCYKCQRLARYYNYLGVRNPSLGFDKFIDFEDLGVAKGTMLSYSMQYQIFEDHPNLPWDRSICIDNENLKLLDYRTGNRILKVLMSDYGFEYTIMSQLYKNQNAVNLVKGEAIIESLVGYLDIDYMSILKDNPVKLNNSFLELPGEKEFRDSATPEMKEELAKLDVGTITSHVDRFPIFVESEEGLGGQWKWVKLERTGDFKGPEVKDLKLSQKALDNVLVRRWLSAKSVLGGLDHYKIKYSL